MMRRTHTARGDGWNDFVCVDVRHARGMDGKILTVYWCALIRGMDVGLFWLLSVLGF